jgi:ferrous iron transport protein B
MTYYPRLPEARRNEITVASEPRIEALSAKLQEWQQERNSIMGAASEGKSYDPDRLAWLNSRIDAEGQELTALEESQDRSLGAAQIRQSIAGRIGHFLEPAIKPLGYDWKMGVGLVGAFAAREVFVSTMGIIYSVGDVEDQTTDLESAMKSDRYPDGRPVWTTPVALSLLVWFVLAMQCMSTLAIVRRETGGWKWPLFMLAYMNVLAYVAALATYQIAKLVVA